MPSSFQTSVITPEGTVFEGPAEFVAIPAIDGELGILHNRAPLLAKLGAGRLRVESGATSRNGSSPAASPRCSTTTRSS